MHFRRRRFQPSNPPLRRALRRAGVRVRRELRLAHSLAENGQFLESANIFERLAQAAQSRGLPQYSQLLIQAGRARINGGETSAGAERIKTGIRALLDAGRIERVSRLRPMLQEFFHLHGLDSEWQAIQSQLDEVGLLNSATPHLTDLRLPAKCPYCGGSLIPEELEEVGVRGAICGYCGSLVQAEGNRS
jgi:hypothetical protein